MTQWFYLLVLLVGIGGILAIDWRHKVAFFANPKRTALTIATGMTFLIIWDLIGIGAGIFFSGNSRFALPLRIAPEFPIEELCFLFLLCYVTLVLYVTLEKKWRHTF